MGKWGPQLVADVRDKLGLVLACNLQLAVGFSLLPLDVGDDGEIERSVAEVARASNGGMVVTASPVIIARRALITRHESSTPAWRCLTASR
jgi:hypothetical protein